MNFDVNNATGPELLAFYNEHAPAKVKRFSDLATARKRVQKLIEEIKMPIEHEQDHRAEAAKSSWTDEKVRAARRRRDAVFFRGKVYRSVAHAFQECGLPIGRSIAFRMKLKSSERGVALFEDERFVLLGTKPEHGATKVDLEGESYYVRSPEAVGQ